MEVTHVMGRVEPKRLDLPMGASTIFMFMACCSPMKTIALEQRLLSVYKQAVRQHNWLVADHLLSAIEACAPPGAELSETVAEAYRALAAQATAPGERQ